MLFRCRAHERIMKLATGRALQQIVQLTWTPIVGSDASSKGYVPTSMRYLRRTDHTLAAAQHTLGA